MYQVIKALSAMRLCKEDSTACPILVRHPAPASQDFTETYKLYDPAKPQEDHVPCIFQGSIGLAYNRKALDEAKITHIVTCADNLNPRFPEDFKYLTLPLLDTPIQNIV